METRKNITHGTLLDFEKTENVRNSNKMKIMERFTISRYDAWEFYLFCQTFFIFSV